ncbi:MAG: protein-glutamate O-methyltransferase CheR [Deltaproteobacteria bacterium]|nr:protein-glutamate O-methyltransferase CheR [Deltaproteobacteria bacterium]MBW1932503.1 protein-glutamate O-methyltransferase CheR [Deltaproteobacteria bacterium]MBW2079863.1 protein-glutamate O-methyltransferase CheR [Deltaproteobacteria bacterium]
MVDCLSEKEFQLFKHFVKNHIGVSLDRTKKAFLQRKLASRLNTLGLESYSEYYFYLLRDKEGEWELRQLINTITVDQSAFFRHPKQFELLANVILPQVAIQKNTTKKLRIWSAGCAIGQEAYSVAMVVNEMFKEVHTWDIRILASDINTYALKFAYKSLYPKKSIQQVPIEYLNRYFRRATGKNSGFFHVMEALKKRLLFRRLNFVNFDFPFRSPVDIIFCRNVMIYFDIEVKKRLVDNFFRLLERDGFLCLGTSESLIGIDDRFALMGHFMYQKKG